MQVYLLNLLLSIQNVFRNGCCCKVGTIRINIKTKGLLLTGHYTIMAPLFKEDALPAQ
mgnify:CR=1